MEKKYKLTSEKIEHLGKTLYRIEALIDFGNVKKGDKGGFIERENNLSQNGDAWIYGDAKIYDNAWIYDNARIYGNARISGNAKIYDNAWISGNERIYGDAWIYGDAKIYDNAWIYGNARIYGNAKIYGNAEISGKIKIESGYFFGMRYKKEEIKYVENEGQEIIYKGDAKFGIGEIAVDPVAKLGETININGKTYKRVD